MRTTTTLLLAGLAALPGCACDHVPAGAVQDCQVGAVVPEAVQTDILFVIDDSLSMDEEQTNLRDNLGAFIDTLVASPVANDFRIGVTTTSVEGFSATAINFQAHSPASVNPGDPAAGVPYPDGALVAIRQDAGGNGLRGDFDYDPARPPATMGWGGARVLDRSAGDLAALARDFKANVLVGTYGSGKEQHFRAARLALSERLLDANAGFLRPGARLAVFFVTDEDDCSDSVDPRVSSNDDCHDVGRIVKNADPPLLDTVDDFAAFLLGPIDGELREVVVGAIAGFDRTTLAPSCGYAQCPDKDCSTAYDKGDRFAALAQRLGGAHMRLGSICAANFAANLQAFAESLTPSSLPLSGAPADWRMLAVTVTRGTTRIACQVAPEGSTAAGLPGTGAVYDPPRFGRPAQLTFQNDCALQLGDRIGVQLVCAN